MEAFAGHGTETTRLSRKQRHKWLAWGLLLASLAITILLSWLPGRLVLSRFRTLEHLTLQRDIHRVLRGFDHDLGSLQDLARDWSGWDDAYKFVGDENPTFAKANLDWVGLSQVSHLQLLAFHDLQGRILWRGFRIDDLQTDLPFPAHLSNPRLVQEFPGGFQGLLLTEEGPMLVVARPVLPTGGKGTSRGLLIMGRMMGVEQLEALSKRTAMDITLRDTLRAPLLPEEGNLLAELRRQPRLAYQPERVLATVLIPDLANRGGVLLTLNWPREVYLQGLQASRTLSLSLLGALVLISTLLLVGFRRYRAVIKRTQRELTSLVAVRTAELHAANRALEDTSMRDPLTGLSNRRFVATTLPPLAQQTLRSSRSRDGVVTSEDMVFILMDLDHFKSVNDLYGHAAGDAVLQQVADILRSSCRETDTVARWGGEEFLLVANRTHRAIAPRLSRLIMEAIQAHPFKLPDGTVIQKTCSIGWCAFPFPPEAQVSLAWEQVLELADLCLYAAKRSGRNGWVGVECPPGANHAALAARLPGHFLSLVSHGELIVRCSWDDPSVLEWR